MICFSLPFFFPMKIPWPSFPFFPVQPLLHNLLHNPLLVTSFTSCDNLDSVSTCSFFSLNVADNAEVLSVFSKWVYSLQQINRELTIRGIEISLCELRNHCNIKKGKSEEKCNHWVIKLWKITECKGIFGRTYLIMFAWKGWF